MQRRRGRVSPGVQDGLALELLAAGQEHRCHLGKRLQFDVERVEG
jgi:hypothetical protein